MADREVSVHSTVAGNVGDVPYPEEERSTQRVSNGRVLQNSSKPTGSSPLKRLTLLSGIGSFGKLRPNFSLSSLKQGVSFKTKAKRQTSSLSLSSQASIDSNPGNCSPDSVSRVSYAELRPTKNGEREFYLDNGYLQYGVGHSIGRKDQDRFDIHVGDEGSSDVHTFIVVDGHGSSALAAEICERCLFDSLVWSSKAKEEGVIRGESEVEKTETPRIEATSISADFESCSDDNNTENSPFNFDGSQKIQEAEPDKIINEQTTIVLDFCDEEKKLKEQANKKITSGEPASLAPLINQTPVLVQDNTSNIQSGLSRVLLQEKNTASESIPPLSSVQTFKSTSRCGSANSFESTDTGTLTNDTAPINTMLRLTSLPSDEAIKIAFLEADKAVQDQRHLASRAGACLAVLMLENEEPLNSFDSPESEMIRGKVAWVGDCRCMMIANDGTVTALTIDHRPDVHKFDTIRLEKLFREPREPRKGLLDSELWKSTVENHTVEGKSIEALRSSSFIAQRELNGKPIGPRCVFSHTGGVSLQVTRSVGDAYGARAIHAEPEITSFSIKRGEYVRFVIGSDGVFDALSELDCAQICSKTKHAGKAAVKLVSSAKHKRLYGGMSVDDITCIVVDVNPEARSKQFSSPKLGPVLPHLDHLRLLDML